MYYLEAEILGLCILGVLVIMVFGIYTWINGVTNPASRIAVYVNAALLALFVAYLIGTFILGTIH